MFHPLDDESYLADDFIVRGPVIGPLIKQDDIKVLDYFGMYKAFPNLDNNCFGWSIDPDDPWRVCVCVCGWVGFPLRATGTYQQPLGVDHWAKLLHPEDKDTGGRPERGC